MIADTPASETEAASRLFRSAGRGPSVHRGAYAPSDKSTRREFLVTTSSAALGAAVPLPGGQKVSPFSNTPRASSFVEGLYSPEELFQSGPQGTFTGDRATQIAMPLGGIGAGCICLNGYGGLQDFSVWNHPATTALPEGYASSQAGFAILHVKGASPVTKLVEGPFPILKIYDQGLQGQGYRRGGFEGLPRFEKCIFRGQYPFGEAQISDASIPLQVSLSAWNPFIPLDDENSGIPCAILEYTLRNASSRKVEYEFSYHLSHLAPGCGDEESKSRNSVIPGRGVFLHNVEEPTAEGYGSACLIAIGGQPRIKGMWLRSPGWSLTRSRHSGAKSPRGLSRPMKGPTRSTPAGGMADPFFSREH